MALLQSHQAKIRRLGTNAAGVDSRAGDEYRAGNVEIEVGIAELDARAIRALIGHFGREGIRTPPDEVSAVEWRFNLKHAERILLKNRRRLLGLSALDVARSLCAGKKACAACRTPILHGFRLGGQRIRRTREYSDDVCKKTAQRRQKSTTKGKGAHYSPRAI